jgi:hypothetical protein
LDSFFQKRGFLERLNAGEVVVGDGGFVFALEKRGYVKAGPWTPEAVLEHPDAGIKYIKTILFCLPARLFCKNPSYKVS